MEEILDMLGNETRREILSLLSQEPRYVSEISRILNIGQKAIIEHLELLRQAGIIDAKYKKIEKGRPRKYYCIRRDLIVEIKIGHHLYDITAFTPSIDPEVLKDFPKMKGIVERIGRALEEENKISSLKSILEEIEEEKKRITEAKKILEYLSSKVRYLIRREIAAEEIKKEFYKFI
ncbi:MAG: transcriptional regulator [Candidatus Hydrothermarchaeota archaeon]|nr:MAG: transcriptional regulator [Candidatus Hydrothermarchaeota archaeon]